MTTVRQIERSWTGRDYGRLFTDLLSTRPEAVFRAEFETSRPALAAAMAVIRLEELSQSHVPLYARLLRAILAEQEADGGWGDAATTAVCLRALLCGRGNGVALDRGMRYLANLQKTEGIWPNLPLKRLAGDAPSSAFILYQLGDNPQFRKAVRFAEAVGWFQSHASSLDEEARQMWEHASLRCRVRPMPERSDSVWLTIA